MDHKLEYRAAGLLAASIIAGVVFVIGAIAIIWKLSLHESATYSSSLIGLLGVTISAAVTFSGVLLKHALDRRSAVIQESAESRLQLEAEHHRSLAKQAEERLRLDTALRAVELIGKQSNSVPPPQNAGALLALVSLGQLDFALPLLEAMWPKQEVDSESAIWVIGRALESGEALQNDAVNILYENYRQLVKGDSFLWPVTMGILSWNLSASRYARERVLEILIRLVLTAPPNEWARDSLRTVITIAYSALRSDPHPRIRVLSAHILTVLLEIGLAKNILFTPTEQIPVRQVHSDVEKELEHYYGVHASDGISDSFGQLLVLLSHWAGEETSSSQSTPTSFPGSRIFPDSSELTQSGSGTKLVADSEEPAEER